MAKLAKLEKWTSFEHFREFFDFESFKIATWPKIRQNLRILGQFQVQNAKKFVKLKGNREFFVIKAFWRIYAKINVKFQFLLPYELIFDELFSSFEHFHEFCASFSTQKLQNYNLTKIRQNWPTFKPESQLLLVFLSLSRFFREKRGKTVHTLPVTLFEFQNSKSKVDQKFVLFTFTSQYRGRSDAYSSSFDSTHFSCQNSNFVSHLFSRFFVP